MLGKVNIITVCGKSTVFNSATSRVGHTSPNIMFMDQHKRSDLTLID